ncbi:MAG: esterase-like activity of phytase family protein [Erythrobacter sp.]
MLRTEVSRKPSQDVSVTQIAGPAATGSPQWQRVGVWHYQGEGLSFGGFSALLALRGNQLRAFSDRGYRFTLAEPDSAGLPPEGARPGVRLQLVERGWGNDLWDIEAATRDPATGTYWLGYENHHAIHRFTLASQPAGVRDLKGDVDWPVNAGIEAMVRLSDGRFVILPEGQPRGLLFAADPVEGGAPDSFAITAPARDFVITGAKQLPDGRLLALMRKVERPSRRTWPPFGSLLAIGDAPQAGGTFAPEIVLRLEDVLPRENYEGLAVRARGDGRVDVWIIADDNLSVFQRTLLAKLVFDPNG